MATEAQRAHIKASWEWLHTYAVQLAYPPNDVRGPLDAATFRMSEQTAEHVLESGGRLTADCSELATEVCRWAGLADPNGLGYRYAGYTGTMLAHLPHYTNGKDAMIGALVVFGPGTGHHVQQVIEADPKGGDPLTAGHGAPGLQIARVSEVARWQPPGVTYLSIAHL